jgi:hypothetical protein
MMSAPLQPLTAVQAGCSSIPPPEKSLHCNIAPDSQSALEEGCVSAREGGGQSRQDDNAVPWRTAQRQQCCGQRHSEGCRCRPAGTVQCPRAHRPDQGSECIQCQAKDAMGQCRARTSSPSVYPPPPRCANTAVFAPHLIP